MIVIHNFIPIIHLAAANDTKVNIFCNPALAIVTRVEVPPFEHRRLSQTPMKRPRFQFGKRSPKPHPQDLSQVNLEHPIYKTYKALSSAPIETIWQIINDVAEMSSWHPLITSTNAPRGLTAKPGLIYRVIPRWLPIPIRIFVERVSHHELISVRLFPMPGLEERVVYRLESTVCGTQVSYSVILRGWLSPVVWSVLKPFAAKVAGAIAKAAEETAATALNSNPSNSEAW